MVTIPCLRSLGFDVEDELFAAHSRHFRNALVRANDQNVAKGIASDTFCRRTEKGLSYVKKKVIISSA